MSSETSIHCKKSGRNTYTSFLSTNILVLQVHILALILSSSSISEAIFFNIVSHSQPCSSSNCPKDSSTCISQFSNSNSSIWSSGPFRHSCSSSHTSPPATRICELRCWCPGLWHLCLEIFPMIGLETSYIIQIQQTTAVPSPCIMTLLRVHLQWGAVLLQVLNSGYGSFLISALAVGDPCQSSGTVIFSHEDEASSSASRSGVTTTDVTCSSAGMTGFSRGTQARLLA